MSILKRRGEEVDIDGLKLPKYGALKVSEVQSLTELSRNWTELSKGLTSEQAAIEMTLQCLTILLKRLDPEWTIERTRAKEWTLRVDSQSETFEPDAILTEALYNFWQGERDRWPEPDTSEEDTQTEAPGKRRTGKKSTGGARKRTQAAKTSKA